MPLSIQTKQVAGVTLTVGIAVVLLSSWYLTSLAYTRLDESRNRAEVLANVVFQRAQYVVAMSADPMADLKNDIGVKNILQGSMYSHDVLYAAIVDPEGVIVAHNDESQVDGSRKLPPADDLSALIERGALAQAQAIFAAGGSTLEFRQRLVLQTSDGGSRDIGSIRIGISTLLIRSWGWDQFRTPLLTGLFVLIGAILVAMLLAQVVLRPIHVIRSGLARLGRGELDVSVDFPQDSDLGDLGASFKAVSSRLAADRTALAGQTATLESVVDHLEDAVALFSQDGQLLFANPAMRATLGAEHGAMATLLPAGHPYRVAVEGALAGHGPTEPLAVDVPPEGERLVLTHAVGDVAGRPMGVMLVARNLAYLTQVESTLNYSRKLAALGRLSAGVAHEIKNPLNATMIHLELLKMRLSDQPDALGHVGVIADQVRRLDEVVQGFLKFTRPEELHLHPVALAALCDSVLPVIQAEAADHGIDVRVDCSADLPPVNADAGLLGQAFLNLGLNACQAMPNGGRLRISAARRPGRRLEVSFEDTGVGMSAEQLPHIFDLYFTTKARGTGIGLSLVYRTVQLHDGEITVESAPGRGTTFKVLLRQAADVPLPREAAARS